jgi:hypothetical protein
MRTVLCVVLLSSPTWGQSLLREFSNSQISALGPLGTEINFQLTIGQGWDIVATAADLGATFHAPSELLPLYNRTLNQPGPVWADMRCCGGGNQGQFAGGLYGYRITDVTQTIDEFAYEQVEMTNRYRAKGKHTARIYGFEIPAMPGDFNRDGFVDGADYTRWRNVVADSGELANSTIGYALPADYALWRANFGRSAFGGGLSSAAIPEPSTIVLLLFAHCLWIRLPRS